MMAIKLSVLSFFLLGISICAVAQAPPKKMLTEADYGLWSTLQLRTPSEQGGWISYHLSYDNGKDTLSVRNKAATKTYSFAKGTEGHFYAESWYACKQSDTLVLLNLKTGALRKLASVVQFAFLKDKNTLLTLNASQQLTVSRPDGSSATTLAAVTGLYLNPQENGFVYTTSTGATHGLYYGSVAKGSFTANALRSDATAGFESIIWQKNGRSFAFVMQSADSTDSRNGRNLHLYRFDERRFFDYTASRPTIATDYTIESPMWTRFSISEDGRRVFFYILKNASTATEKNAPVQVWQTEDSWTYPQKQREGYFNDGQRFVVWYPDEERVALLTSAERPLVMLSGDQQYAVTYNPMGKKPEVTFYNSADFYVRSLKTGEDQLLLSDQPCEMSEITVSPDGNYLLYRKQDHWWLYEFGTGKHSDLSLLIPTSLLDVDYDRSDAPPFYGIGGWTAHDGSLVLYDQYDLWEVSLKQLTARRLTHGREKGIQFRVAASGGAGEYTMNINGMIYPKVAITNGCYLKAYTHSTKQSGYYYWNVKERLLVLEDKAVSNLHVGGTVIYYKEQRFDQPPGIVCIDRKSVARTKVFQSNPQQDDYYWGFSKLIHYTTPTGKNLQAALYYPVDYDPTKKYPMVVYIYETLSKQLHEYSNPSLHNVVGINYANLTSKGYFVLCPDISYELNKVGYSATDCTVAATKAVIESGLVDPTKIALDGHSFGGYEVNFIATQTDVFATIISGASVSDVVNAYFSIGWNNGRPELWRYENFQWRMADSFFEDSTIYHQNSPLTYATNITTPMLIWTGEKDLQVHYLQSVNFYTALRRLGKRATMLIYPETRHSLSLPNYQEDFTHKFEHWLDVYLKNETPENWMVR